MEAKKRLIIIGAGFAGLKAARALAKQALEVILIDRNNYHTFTPLLYQVATSGLDPSAVAYPVRSIFAGTPNVRFLMGEVTAIDTQKQAVTVQTNSNGLREEAYDYLFVAAGSKVNYFGNEGVAKNSFPLRDLDDALSIRNHILRLFEKAAWTDDKAKRDALMTLVVVGGGPTGLETAGALYELYNGVLDKDYDKDDKMQARVILVEAADKVLLPYPPKLQEAAKKQLEDIGIEVRLNTMVEDVGADFVKLRGGETIQTYTVVWSTGVVGSPIARMLGVELEKSGRIPVKDTLEVIGLNNVFAAGDIAYLIQPETNEPYPGLILIAQQEAEVVAIEDIDIGGVTLIRAAAKNFFRVITICDPADYSRVSAALKAAGEIDLAMRRDLAVKAFDHTREYDTAIHAFLSQDLNAPAQENEELPKHLAFAVHEVEQLRYGENPHQSGTYYAKEASAAPLGAKVFGGKQLSYNNILDIDAAWRAVSSFDAPTVVIVKHLTPMGIASADTVKDAFSLALAADPVSAFGGIVAVNRSVDEDFVTALGSLFIEAIAAPDYTEASVEALNKSRKNCRILQIPKPYDRNGIDIRTVHGGLLIQRLDNGDPEGTILKTVTERAPSAEELAALEFAWKACMHVKSNSIVLAKKNRTVGVGGGLPSRVDAVELAIRKAGWEAKDSVMASDAFFPFPDGPDLAIKAGVTAIIQPGGSIRDQEVIDACNKAGVAMVFTGTRHFRH